MTVFELRVSILHRSASEPGGGICYPDAGPRHGPLPACAGPSDGDTRPRRFGLGAAPDLGASSDRIRAATPARALPPAPPLELQLPPRLLRVWDPPLSPALCFDRPRSAPAGPAHARAGRRPLTVLHCCRGRQQYSGLG